MGAWIETKGMTYRIKVIKVAPYMGAWIETRMMVAYNTDIDSRTLHGCVD